MKNIILTRYISPNKLKYQDKLCGYFLFFPGVSINSLGYPTRLTTSRRNSRDAIFVSSKYISLIFVGRECCMFQFLHCHSARHLNYCWCILIRMYLFKLLSQKTNDVIQYIRDKNVQCIDDEYEFLEFEFNTRILLNGR